MIESSSGRQTVPQIFIDGRHIGGFDDLSALDASGELDRLARTAGRTNPSSNTQHRIGFTMADEQPNTAAQKQLLLQKIYVKDLSFESPKAPRGVHDQRRAADAAQHPLGHPDVAPNTHEVTLTLTVEAKDQDATLFLIEIAQAGIFSIQGYIGRRAGGADRQLLPEYAVSVRARGDCRPRRQRRLPAVAAATDQLRRALRAGHARARGAQTAAAGRHRGRRRGDALATEPHRRARRRLLGHGARHPVRARRPPGRALGPRRGARRRHGARPAQRALSPRRAVSRPARESLRDLRRRVAARR